MLRMAMDGRDELERACVEESGASSPPPFSSSISRPPQLPRPSATSFGAGEGLAVVCVPCSPSPWFARKAKK